ncbi:MAG: electron transport complex subunit RsxB [Pseudomonadales bacterium]|nr:electron transport complex subunit RsxB [Pseudomonadales bacterium]
MIYKLLSAIGVLGTIALFTGALLGWLNKRYKKQDKALVDVIEELLPLTQCAQCGYPGCRPYAQSIAEGGAINKCPPGGEDTIARLANLLGREPSTLDENFGQHSPIHLAVIDERSCIGCTLCIQVCPVDAIVGAQRFMHTVLEDHCTGCELCLEPCPVDCISLINTDIQRVYLPA